MRRLATILVGAALCACTGLQDPDPPCTPSQAYEAAVVDNGGWWLEIVLESGPSCNYELAPSQVPQPSVAPEQVILKACDCDSWWTNR